ncbi:MAG: hypothetical protein PHR06_06425, partial [Candidatus Cloacimonetes bacterium]|nr:hypothetical protein [Candidatus Cloacimonadota bacterium]
MSDKQLLINSIVQSPTKITSIIGLAKNSGKTSFMNWLLEKSSFQKVGVITTGRDGEETDLVSNNKKPKVIVPKGTFFTTFEQEVSKHSGLIRVIGKLPYRVIGKQLWLAFSEAALEIEIVGPTSATEK